MPTDAQIIAHLESSNIKFRANSRQAGTWRWPDALTQPLLVHAPRPRAGDAVEADYFSKVHGAARHITAKLHGLLELRVTSEAPGNRDHIRISYNSAYVPPGCTDYENYCANVSNAVNSGAPIWPDEKNNIGPRPVYINIGNGHCHVSQDIVEHEFGHALGLSDHFYGFGDGPAISDIYFDVLSTLYGNPQSTTVAKIVVRRAR